jgi:decaprenylphospho-beta-D-ribofuranose 2-oxidase
VSSVAESRRLHGWGRTSPVVSRALAVDADQVAEALRNAGPRGLVARGLGRSYGDAAQNAGGTVLLPIPGETRMEGDHVVVSAGTSLHDLMHYLLPRRRFLPVTPGTRYVTVGGAIACDVHGKSHHRVGTFGANLVSADLVTPDGATHRISATEDPELFWATVGGMGLTGVIVRATLRTIPVETGWIRVDTERFGDLGSLTAAMRESDHAWTYSVAWVDTVSRGQALGRSVLSRGEHAQTAELDGCRARTPYPLPGEPRLSAPPWAPDGLVSRASVRAFNELWFRKAPRHREGELVGPGMFFCPLDLVGQWNRLYGRRGMVQYQFVVPFGEEATMRRVIERLVASGTASFLAVLKRFGAGNPGPLSFPMPGWTLALDVPAAAYGLGEMFHELDDLVLDAGGRHYFAKDAHTTPAAIRRGYPRLDEWRAVRDAVDPGRVWQSDLARRLELIDRLET